MNHLFLITIFLLISSNSFSNIDSVIVKCPTSNKLVKATLYTRISSKDGETVFLTPQIKYRCFLQFNRSVSGFFPDRSTLDGVCPMLTQNKYSVLLDYSESVSDNEYKLFINDDGNPYLNEAGNSFMDRVVCSI
jgi:hypothetical protein